MDPVILVLNSGSSSIKFTLYSGDTVQLKGQISGLGAQPHISLASRVSDTRVDRQLSADEGRSHGASLAALLPVLEQELGGRSVDAVGHRVVHGGVTHTEPVRLTAEILEDLKALEPLAPLHQPHNLAGITAAREAFPEAMQVACFDTAENTDLSSSSPATLAAGVMLGRMIVLSVPCCSRTRCSAAALRRSERDFMFGGRCIANAAANCTLVWPLSELQPTRLTRISQLEPTQALDPRSRLVTSSARKEYCPGFCSFACFILVYAAKTSSLQVFSSNIFLRVQDDRSDLVQQQCTYCSI